MGYEEQRVSTLTRRRALKEKEDEEDPDYGKRNSHIKNLFVKRFIMETKKAGERKRVPAAKEKRALRTRTARRKGRQEANEDIGLDFLWEKYLKPTKSERYSDHWLKVKGASILGAFLDQEPSFPCSFVFSPFILQLMLKLKLLKDIKRNVSQRHLRSLGAKVQESRFKMEGASSAPERTPPLRPSRKKQTLKYHE